MLFRFVVAETLQEERFVSQLRRSQSTRVGRYHRAERLPSGQPGHRAEWLPSRQPSQSAEQSCSCHSSRSTEKRVSAVRFLCLVFYSLSAPAYWMVLLTFRINPVLKHLHQHTQRCALMGFSYLLLSPVKFIAWLAIMPDIINAAEKIICKHLSESDVI